MKRLTEWTGEKWIAKQERINGKYPNDDDLFQKLAEYEDIGLTPEEIKLFLGDFGVTVTKRNRELIKELQEYRKLKMEGKLIKLPCIVGDSAILIFDDFGELFITNGWELVEITILEDDIIFAFKCYATNDEEERSLEDFGKTVFLTEEEAKNALKD